MQTLLVDSSVILDVLADDPEWCAWSMAALEKASRDRRLIINPVVYTEVSIGFQKIEEVEAAIDTAGLRVMPIPREALFLAGKAFLSYRRQQGTKRSPLPDFFIGAHAAVAGIELLTRDPARVAHYFPGVGLITP